MAKKLYFWGFIITFVIASTIEFTPIILSVRQYLLLLFFMLVFLFGWIVLDDKDQERDKKIVYRDSDLDKR